VQILLPVVLCLSSEHFISINGCFVMFRNIIFFLSITVLSGMGCTSTHTSKQDKTMSFPTSKSEQEWQNELSPEQYRILREKGTERAFTGEYWNHHDLGVYSCAGCGQELFESDSKFDSGCGWPSYFKPIRDLVISEARDTSHGMIRTEVMCSQCGGHLGHVFNDGPPPTGLRYCINSGALKFKPNTP
jgi:peptide-methionine (R)-S-oxide reductase